MSLVTIRLRRDFHMNVLVRFWILKGFQYKISKKGRYIIYSMNHKKLFGHKEFYYKLASGICMRKVRC